MNKKGEGGIFGIIFFIIIFVIFYVYALAPVSSVASDTIISGSHPTGVFGFFMGNLPIWILLIFLVVIFYKGGFGG